MPTDEVRIETLKKRIAARTGRLENLPTVKKIKTANEADEAILAELAANRDKKLAAQQRIDDNHAKTLIGVAALQLPAATLLRAMRVLCAFLKGRHREFLVKWFAQREMDITGPTTEEFPVGELPATSVNAATHPSPASPDPIGIILKKVIGKLGEGAFGLVGPEILSAAEEEDKRVLEVWYAKLDQDRQSSQKGTESGRDQEATPPEL